MRLTLDKGAMEVLLNSMTEEARLDFSTKVMNITLQKLANNLNAAKVKKLVDAETRTILDDYVKNIDSYKPELQPLYKSRIKNLVAAEFKAQEEERLKTLNYKMGDAQRDIRKYAAEQATGTVDSVLSQRIDELTLNSLREHLSGLIELGNTLQSMTVVKAPSESQEPGVPTP